MSAHDEFIQTIRGLQAKLKDDAGAMETLELTAEEQEVIGSLPPAKLALLDSILARYIPVDPAIDIRRKTVEKGIAIMLMKSEPYLKKAYALGRKTGGRLG